MEVALKIDDSKVQFFTHLVKNFIFVKIINQIRNSLKRF